MDRRGFIKQTAAAALGGLTVVEAAGAPVRTVVHEKKSKVAPRAITMWDFSWLERRWPGAGYEDWDKALDELAERGYNAIRIDAYPHLVAENPDGKWLLKEVWNQQDWGSPDLNEVQVQPALNQFLAKCKERGIKVGAFDAGMESTVPLSAGMSSSAALMCSVASCCIRRQRIFAYGSSA